MTAIICSIEEQRARRTEKNKHLTCYPNTIHNAGLSCLPIYRITHNIQVTEFTAVLFRSKRLTHARSCVIPPGNWARKPAAETTHWANSRPAPSTKPRPRSRALQNAAAITVAAKVVRFFVCVCVFGAPFAAQNGAFAHLK